MFDVFAGRFAFDVFDVFAVLDVLAVFDVPVLPVEVVFAVFVVVVVVLVVVVVFDTFAVLVLARFAFALEAVLVLAASPQAIPRALRPRTAERTTFFIMENSPVFSKVKLA